MLEKSFLITHKVDRNFNSSSVVQGLISSVCIKKSQYDLNCSAQNISVNTNFVDSAGGVSIMPHLRAGEELTIVIILLEDHLSY